MTLTTDDVFRHSVVLTVDERRCEKFMERWESYGLIRPLKMIGYKLRIGNYNELNRTHIDNSSTNCCFSHAAAVKMAQTLGWPFVCIFEDDALPCRSILKKLPDLLKDLPDDTDVLKLGVMEYRDPEIARRGKLIARNAWGTHAYIVFRQYFDRYDDIFNNVNMICDGILVNYTPRVHGPECRIWTSEENLFAQKDPLPDYEAMHKDWTKTCGQEKLPNGDDFDWS